nr:immunoglobulin heavy chain junction region [Mus musculus]MBK4188013.1 immunoglobulin heavy chain junction region [Mus musculus]MBK4188014.1 immunoglobulin heavy chain junction region [Mus musculus]
CAREAYYYGSQVGAMDYW